MAGCRAYFLPIAISQVKTVEQLNVKLFFYMLYKMNRFINGTAAGASLAFVNN